MDTTMKLRVSKKAENLQATVRLHGCVRVLSHVCVRVYTYMYITCVLYVDMCVFVYAVAGYAAEVTVTSLLLLKEEYVTYSKNFCFLKIRKPAKDSADRVKN